jgi:hypothetical protein
MIDTDLRTYIIGLGTAAGDRVFIGSVDATATRPLVIIRRTGGSQRKTLSGVSLFRVSTFAIDVITNQYPHAYPVSEAILTALHGFKGLLGSTVVQLAKCIEFPSDQSEVDGDLVTRWVASQYQFTH